MENESSVLNIKEKSIADNIIIGNIGKFNYFEKESNESYNSFFFEGNVKPYMDKYISKIRFRIGYSGGERHTVYKISCGEVELLVTQRDKKDITQLTIFGDSFGMIKEVLSHLEEAFK